MLILIAIAGVGFFALIVAQPIAATMAHSAAVKGRPLRITRRRVVAVVSVGVLAASALAGWRVAAVYDAPQSARGSLFGPTLFIAVPVLILVLPVTARRVRQEYLRLGRAKNDPV